MGTTIGEAIEGRIGTGPAVTFSGGSGDPWLGRSDPWAQFSNPEADNEQSRKRGRANLAGLTEGSPAGDKPVTLEDLSALTEKFLPQPKQAYKDAKGLLEQSSSKMVRIYAPGLTLQACGAAMPTLRMIGDSAAERRVICGKDSVHVHNRRSHQNPIILETANGEATIAEEGNTSCARIRLENCLLCPTASSSLLATVLLADAGWSYN